MLVVADESDPVALPPSRAEAINSLRRAASRSAFCATLAWLSEIVLMDLIRPPIQYIFEILVRDK